MGRGRKRSREKLTMWVVGHLFFSHRNPFVGKVDRTQQDIDRGKQIAGRFPTDINRGIFPGSSHMMTPDLGTSGQCGFSLGIRYQYGTPGPVAVQTANMVGHSCISKDILKAGMISGAELDWS